MGRRGRLVLRAAFTVATAGSLMVAVNGTALASVSTDGYYYVAGDTVHISGDQMAADENVTVDVDYPDGTLAQEDVVTADDSGAFTDAYTLTSGSPPGIYTVVAKGQTSGVVFTTTFDPTTVITGTSPSSITYGDSTTTRGTFVANGTVKLYGYSDGSCSMGQTLLATTTAGTGDDAQWWATYYPPAGNWYLKAVGTPGGSNNAFDSLCTGPLMVAKADTTTTSNPETTTVGTGQTFNIDYDVSSDRGVTNNTATGTVTAAGDTTPLGCPTTGTSISAPETTGSGFDFAANAGSHSNSRISCTAGMTTGTYTIYVQFADTDGNYNGSDSSAAPGQVTVTAVNVQVCKAAPAIAVAYMTSKGIKPSSKKWTTVINDVAHQLGPNDAFFAQNVCSDTYAGAVTTYIHNTYGI